MRRRKKNFYFDRKSMGFKRGIRPASKSELRASRKSFQSGVARKRRALKGAREKQAGTLFKQLQRDAKPQRARRAKLSGRDKELWEQLLKSNPGIVEAIRPGDRVTIINRFGQKSTGRAVMRSSSGGWVLNMGGPHGTPGIASEENIVSVKKRNPKKKKRSRKGKMPAGLAAYWRKKRAKKAKRKNPKKRPRAKVRRPRRCKTVRRRVRNYRHSARKVRRRRVRRAKRNPVRRRTRIIKAPYGLSGKGLRAWARAKGRELGVPARILGQFRR